MAKKAWLKNGKIIMRDGKAVMCEDCPCIKCTCSWCDEGTTPAWYKIRFRRGVDPDVDMLVFKDPIGCQYSGYLTSFTEPAYYDDIFVMGLLYQPYGLNGLSLTGNTALVRADDGFNQYVEEFNIEVSDCREFLGAEGVQPYSWDREIIQVGPTVGSLCEGGCETGDVEYGFAEDFWDGLETTVYPDYGTPIAVQTDTGLYTFATGYIEVIYDSNTYVMYYRFTAWWRGDHWEITLQFGGYLRPKFLYVGSTTGRCLTESVVFSLVKDAYPSDGPFEDTRPDTITVTFTEI